MTVTAFVSFSGRDSNVAQKLLSALQRQGIDVWDYSREGDAIAPGADIGSECRRRIDHAQYFLAVITASSCSREHGYYPQLETCYALQRRDQTGGAPVIVPVIDTRNPAPEMTGPYRQLAGVLRLSMDSSAQESVDEAVRRFCIDTVRAGCRPSFPIDPRIRLIEGFRAEYEEFERRHSAEQLFSRAEYATLIRSMEQFSRAVSLQPPQWKKALIPIGNALSIIEEHHCEAEFYFPLVMQGLCELELGRLDDAAESFSRADRHDRAHSDAHAMTGLALVSWRRHDYGSALEHLRRAEERCSERVPWELRFNIMCAALAANRPLRFSEELLKVDRTLLTPEDDAKYTTILGIHLLQEGRYHEAKRELIRAVARSDALGDNGPITWLADCMVRLGESRAAVDLLAAQAARRQSGDLYYRAARIRVEMGDLDGAAELYETIATRPRLRAPKHLIEYARVLKVLGRTARMRAVCETLAGDVLSQAVTTPEDRFLSRFAWFLLGKRELSASEHSQAPG